MTQCHLIIPLMDLLLGGGQGNTQGSEHGDAIPCWIFLVITFDRELRFDKKAIVILLQ